MTRRECYAALAAGMDFPSAAWDNDGVMCLPNEDTAVSRVLCALDVTDEVVSYAEREGYDLILSHHPLLFVGVRSLDPAFPVPGRLLRLIKADIAVFSFHTRLDGATDGVNDGLAALLGLRNVLPLGEGEAALGRVGELSAPMSMEAFTALVKERLGASALCGKGVTDTVTRVALVGGEGKDFILDAAKSGADVYLSGRLGYHAMQDAPLSVLEAGHYYTERHAASLLAERVKKLIPDVKVEVYTPNPLAIY